MKNRISRAGFTSITGISKTTFYDRYRWSSKWIKELDIRIEKDSGRLTMDREAVVELARRRHGPRANGRSPRANRLGGHAKRTGGAPQAASDDDGDGADDATEGEVDDSDQDAA